MSLFKRGEASRLTVGIILFVVVAVVSTLILALEKETIPQQAGETQKEPEKKKPAIVPGQIAPDFELPRLTIETDDEGNNVGKISTETVKLSDYRGKRCVFLILSSYT
ncbi:MAG: hypothetical protein ACYS1A_08500 [Planctomycetota bacterium]|jgi:hypothetical protein